jgi:hypothetical protein
MQSNFDIVRLSKNARDHWVFYQLRLALSNGTNRVGGSHHLILRRKQNKI